MKITGAQKNNTTISVTPKSKVFGTQKKDIMVQEIESKKDNNIKTESIIEDIHRIAFDNLNLSKEEDVLTQEEIMHFRNILKSGDSNSKNIAEGMFETIASEIWRV